MEDMHYLKENKKFIYAACLIPLLLFYVDRTTALWFDHTYDDLKIHKVLKYIDPVMNVIGNGLTLIIIGFLLYMIGKYYNRRLASHRQSIIHRAVDYGCSRPDTEAFYRQSKAEVDLRPCFHRTVIQKRI